MSSYVVLARKYRSKQFADLIGQQAVVKTLVNAVRMNRLHHAYIFSGGRGIGKTSIARIFAKVLRCANVQDRDGLLYSCDQCSDCREIVAGSSVDVIEIDGASNNGVESIREIREQVKFLPSSGRFKIYIIDEVHMLTTQSFNALLKTLEEPPEHIVFIFATTEVHKIPETILGRCQRFEFKKVTESQTTQHLIHVARQEGLDAEEAALALIARSAGGSMRDALSLLDQTIAFSEGVVTAEKVRLSLGLLGTERIEALVDAILRKDAPAALQVVQAAFSQGIELKSLVRSVLEMLHAILLAQAGVSSKDLEAATVFSSDEAARIFKKVDLRSIEENELIFQLFYYGLQQMSQPTSAKLLLDVLVMKAALAEVLIPVEEMGSTKSAVKPAVKAETKSETKSETKPVVAIPVPQPVVSGPTWEGFVEHCFSETPVLSVLLESVIEWNLPTADQPTVRLGFRERDRTKADQLLQKPFREQLVQVMESYFKVKAIPEVSLSQLNGESVAERAQRQSAEVREARIQKIHSHPVIQEAKSLFGTDIGNIELNS